MTPDTRPTAHRRTPLRFFVFTSPRSGSSWLIDLLDSHPRMAAYAELFLPGDVTPLPYASDDLLRFEATVTSRRRISLVPARFSYLNRLYRPRADVDAVGFKLMYGHPRVHPGLLAYLTARRVRAVHLVRRNTLDQIVSRETALARRQFRARTGEDVPHVPVRLDTGSLVERIATMEERVARARTTLARRRILTIEVVYEDLRERPEDELARVLSFLGLEGSGPETSGIEDAGREGSGWQPASSLARMNRSPLEALVENYDEVAATLAGTPSDWMLARGVAVEA